MKLNVGSGRRYELGYCNIDLFEDILADKQMSAINLSFPDNSCEEVKAIHVIEHMDFFKSLYALSEFFRVLQSNGVLIIETPDIEKAFQSYLKGDYEQQKEILGWIFGIPHEGLQHMLCYPSKMLTEMLTKVGFNDIQEKRFYNNESIPTLRIQCKKSSEENSFQVITHIRKRMLLENLIDFKDSFLAKEQEELLTSILLKLKEFKVKNEKELLYDIFKNILIRSPLIARIFLNEIEDRFYLSNFEVIYINDIIKYMIEYNLPCILYNSLKKLPIIPGTQQFAVLSIETLGKSIIHKLFFFRNEKQEQLTHLRELTANNKLLKSFFFSQTMLKRKSLEYFYQGIKAVYNQNYEIARRKLLDSIHIFRDDFIYYWNLAKVLVKLNLKSNALKIYKKTLRLLRISRVKNKKLIKKDIDIEISWLKKSKEPLPNFNPIITLDKYYSVN